MRESLGENRPFEQRLWDAGFDPNDTDDLIIQYIRAHREDLPSLSIQKMAKDLYVAPNAIMRFSKKLGYSGFAELKFSLQNEIRPQPKTLSRQLLEMLPENIVKTLDIIDEQQIRQVVSVLRKGRCCILTGVGDSTYFCELLGTSMQCVDYDVKYFTHIHNMVYAVEHGKPEDVLVVISARGENSRLVDLARRGKEIGIEVISITHMCDNPLARVADHSLYFWGEFREVQGYNVTDRTGLMTLIRLLCEAIWATHP